MIEALHAFLQPGRNWWCLALPVGLPAFLICAALLLRRYSKS